MTPAELKRAIDNRQVPTLLCLYGEERFFLERTLKQVENTVLQDGMRDFNFAVFRAKEHAVQDIVDTAMTLPVFADRRLVVVKEAHNLSASDLEALMAFVKSPVPETVLVLVAEKIDARRKFYQVFKKNGQLVEFKRLYDNQIPAFVKEHAREAGFRFTEDGLALFCRRVGSNLQEIQGELTKLFSFLGQNTLVDVADVASVVSDTRVDSIFDLTNAMGQKKADEALHVLGRLLDEGNAPLMILSMMVRHFRLLWKARDLLERKEPRNAILKSLKVNPYFLDGILAQARCYSHQQYRQAFEWFVQVDMDLKSSGGHPRALLEGLVLKLAEKSN